MSVFYSIFFIVVLLFIVCTLLYFWMNTDGYVENMQSIRKTYYVLFVFAVTVGILLEEIKIDDWQMILQLGALFVFIDIAVFQTPDVLKIWNTEFQHSNYIRKTIRKNEEVLGYNAQKVKNFTKVILESNNHFSNVENTNTWELYEKEIKSYLKRYADTFQFQVSVFGFEINQNEDRLKENVYSAFEQVEMCYNYTILDKDWRGKLVGDLISGNSVQLSQKVEDKKPTTEDLRKKAFIVAYYGENYNMLIGINSSNNVDVDGIDASHILNLANIFDWYMV